MSEKDLLPGEELTSNGNATPETPEVQPAAETATESAPEVEEAMPEAAPSAEAAVEDVAPAEEAEAPAEEAEAPAEEAEAPAEEAEPAASEAPAAETSTSDDESDDASDEEKDEHEDHTVDYAEKTTEELLVEAKRVLQEVNIEHARVPMLAIKDILSARWDEERSSALVRYTEEGGNAIDFHYEQPSKDAFYQTFGEFKKRRSAWKTEQSNQMAVNLDLKKALLDEIKKLAESDDLPTGQTYNEFKRINDRWKEVGHVPNDEARDLYASYRFFVDRFYDNLRLSQELRDLDYKHNKELKEALIAEMTTLSSSEWSANVGKELQRLHAAWKEVGPVSLEDKEPLWDQFREASNGLHEKRRMKQEAAKEANDARLVQKEALVQELEALVGEDAGQHGAWQKQTEKAKQLRESMAKVGRTFGGPSDELWDRFKKAEKAFFKARNQYYKERKNSMKEALETKYALVAKAEELTTRTDWAEASKEVKRLQADWKKTGFVPRKDSDKAWVKFRSACNAFFDAMRSAQGDQRAAQKADRQKHEKSLNSRQAVEVARKELAQLENNMGFFQFADPKSPIVQDAMKKVEAARKNLEKAEAAHQALRKAQRDAEKKGQAAVEEATSADDAAAPAEDGQDA